MHLPSELILVWPRKLKGHYSRVKIQGFVTKLWDKGLKVFSIRMGGVDENRLGGPSQKFGESPPAA